MQPAALPVPLLSRAANAAWDLSQRYWRFVLIAALGLLHIAVFRGVTDPWARAMLLAHLGLLLLLQPFLRAEQRITPLQTLGLVIAAVTVMLWLNWWLLALWVIVLAGLVGGKVYQQHARCQRRSYLLALGYLLALLAIVILPEIAPQREIGPEIRQAAEYGLPLLLVLLAFLPADAEPPDAAQVLDFFYSIFVMLLLVVVVLGSFTFMTLGRISYVAALAYTMFLIAGTVLLIALAWDSRPGFAGLKVFFSRYLLSIGLPVEKWLRFLAELQQLETRPARFLSEAVLALANLPWVAGTAWRTANGSGETGRRSPHGIEFANSELALTIYSSYRMSPTLHWHLHLLGQLLAEFYVAKLREEKLRESRYLQAVHETGARMTHDMKNLLQSLNVLCTVAAKEENRNSPEAQALLGRQLPIVALRLSQVLRKLERPADADDEQVDALRWYEDLARQYRAEGVEFDETAVPAGAKLPQSLFSSVADNLIRNALAKRQAGEEVQIRVGLGGERPLQLLVRDSGRSVPPPIASVLLRAPVPSPSGLGIGLYQAARQAESKGWRLALQSNRDGEVCFSLTGPAC
jgi:hypothetical protein